MRRKAREACRPHIFGANNLNSGGGHCILGESSVPRCPSAPNSGLQPSVPLAATRRLRLHSFWSTPRGREDSSQALPWRDSVGILHDMPLNRPRRRDVRHSGLRKQP